MTDTDIIIDGVKFIFWIWVGICMSKIDFTPAWCNAVFRFISEKLLSHREQFETANVIIYHLYNYL